MSRQMYLEDIAHKRENYKMDLWTFGSTEIELPGYERPGHWFDTNTNGFNEDLPALLRRQAE